MTIIIIFILSYVFRFFKQKLETKKKKKSKIEAMILFFDKLKTWKLINLIHS